jgi:hypothetical protein
VLHSCNSGKHKKNRRCQAGRAPEGNLETDATWLPDYEPKVLHTSAGAEDTNATPTWTTPETKDADLTAGFLVEARKHLSQGEG